MAERRMFNQDMAEPAVPFETGGQMDQGYAGNVMPPQGPTKRALSSQDDPDMPVQRYIPPSTMDILLREAMTRER